MSSADWEFTSNSGGVRTHVIDRGAIFSPNRAYGFWWSTRDADWQANLSNFQLIVSTFQGA